MGVAVGVGEGRGVTEGARVAVEVGAAICESVQPEIARHKAIKTMKIRSYLILIITSRGRVEGCYALMVMADRLFIILCHRNKSALLLGRAPEINYIGWVSGCAISTHPSTFLLTYYSSRLTCTHLHSPALAAGASVPQVQVSRFSLFSSPSYLPLH
jgi:hypothetical protein